MINLESLEKTIDNFAYQKMLFKNEDFAYILNREKITSRFNDFLTRAYYQRQNLVKEGFIGVCYTVRVAYSEGKDKNHVTLALFAPNRALMVDEKFFVRIIKNIEALNQKKNKKYSEKKFLNYFNSSEARPRYYKIDESLTEGKRVYLTYIELIPHLNPHFQPQLNYVIYAPLVSKELIYLPERYIKI
ncbi:MAG TPA: hypothetical protein VJZ31_03450 [Bacilli bacterium]|nr:hypothetical protein [Bacilli bacterium]